MTKTDATKQVVRESVDFLSEAKSRAETRVKLARSLLADGGISKKDLRKLEIAYSDARAQVNAGLDRILVELEISRTGAELESYEIVANRAGEQILVFLDASDALILGDDKGSPIEAGLDAAKTFASAFVDIWKTFRGDKKERNAALIKRIESLKWAAFDEIKVGVGVS